MSLVEIAGVLAAFDAQVRRNIQGGEPGVTVEAAGDVVRWVADDRQGWSGITWSGLDEASADAVIAAQVAYFAGRGQRFEWKLYDYDRPPDLARRLLAAGAVPEPEETLMVAQTSQVCGEVKLPDRVRLLPVTDEAGVGLLLDVHERVFGTDHAELGRSLLAQLRGAPEMTEMVVAMADGEPVCSARIEFSRDSDFAGLWGGGTLPSWRGRGIYRALVAYRANLAADRRRPYLQVDASPDSQPILRRLGFVPLARTTPYIWDPGTQA